MSFNSTFALAGGDDCEVVRDDLGITSVDSGITDLWE
jgi:hypothetical protein